MTDNIGTTRGQGSIPLPARLWGYAGVLPFVALTYILVSRNVLYFDLAAILLIPYSAVILTFMGGVHWGLAMQDTDSSGRGLLYTSGILPSLVACLALVLPFHSGLAALVAGLIALLLCDLFLVRKNVLPVWYAHLRLQLTLAVVACLSVVGLWV